MCSKTTRITVRDFLLKEAQRAVKEPMQRRNPEYTPSSSVSADLKDLECSIDEKETNGCVKFFCRPCRCHLFSSENAVDHLCSKEHLFVKNNERKTAKRSVKEKAKNDIKENKKVLSDDEKILFDAIWTDKVGLTSKERLHFAEDLRWITTRVLPPTQCRFCDRKSDSEIERKIHEFTAHTLETAALEKMSKTEHK